MLERSGFTRRSTAGIVTAMAASMASAGALHAASLGTAFTYQGRIENAGVPVDSFCNLEIDLWDAESDGIQIGDTAQFLFQQIIDGAFTVELDFGDIDDGSPKWLEVRVQCIGDGAFATLLPRRELTPVPNVLWAQRAPQQIATGIIVAWSGVLAEIPEGWALCDGTGGTPDLRDKFVMSVGAGEEPGAIAGASQHGHSVPHDHTVDPNAGSLSTAGAHAHDTAAHDHIVDPENVASSNAGNHAHAFDAPSTNTSNSGGHAHSFNPAIVGSNNTGTHSNHSIGNATGTTGWAGISTDDNASRTHSHSDSSTGGHTHAIDFGSTGSSSTPHVHATNLASVGSSTNGFHGHSIDLDPTTSGTTAGTTSTSASHQHSVDVEAFDTDMGSAATGSTAHAPPYYEVAFLMKLLDAPPPGVAATDPPRPTEEIDLNGRLRTVQSDHASFGSTGDGVELTSTFVYQGTLMKNGKTVTGSCEMSFSLWDADTDGDTVASPSSTPVEVQNGAFAAELDFGYGVFQGEALWVEIAVTCPGDDTATTFPQRQALHGTPTALFARESPQQMPSGAILMWSGGLADIPSGWLLCDGLGDTPDLRDRFLRGTPPDTDPGTTGGALSHDHELAVHTHGVDAPATGTTSAGDHIHTTAAHTHAVDPASQPTSTNGTHLHSVNPPSTNFSGGSHSHSVDYPNMNTSANGNHNHSLGQYCGDHGSAGFGDNDGVPTCHSHTTGNSGNHAHAHNPPPTGTSAGSAANHVHSINLATRNSVNAGDHGHGYNIGNTTTTSATMDMQSEGIHAHTFDLESLASGPSEPDVADSDHLPPFYKLAYIMKE